MLLPEDEVQFVYASVTDAASWLQKISTGGQLVTPREHNAGIMGLATLADALSDPIRTQAAWVQTSTGPIYATTQYAGSLVGEHGRTVGAVGFLPRTAFAGAWWDTLAELIDRLGNGYSIVPGQPPASTDTARKDLYAISGPAAFAVIPEVRITPGSMVREDAQSSDAISRLVPQITAIVTSLRAVQSPTVDPTLAAWVTLVSALRQKEQQSYTKQVLIGAALIAGAAALTRLLPSHPAGVGEGFGAP